MKKIRAISGYELMRYFFDAYAETAAEQLLARTGGETEYLELKATCVFDPEDPRNKEGETQNDLSWNIARELIALHNSKGGVLLIGIDDEKPFAHVPLPSYDERNRNDYLRKMVIQKIFPKGSRWSTQNGTKVFSCDDSQIHYLLKSYLEFEYVPYKDGEIVAVFVKPAPCQTEQCISVSYRVNQGDPYDQLPTRSTGNTGEVKVYTKDIDKENHKKTRHRTDEHFATLWQKWDPQQHDKPPRKTHATRATADQGCDPSSDPLIRAIEGCRQETDFSPNTMIGEYKVIRRIGQGGMGIVYEVEHPTLKTSRALKVFAPDDESDPLLQRKFLTEARLLARLNHPGLIRVHSLGVVPETSTLYYEMDLVCNDRRFRRPRSLKALYDNLDNDPPTDRQLRKWFSQLCEVLCYLHEERKIVHRDIKLENILLNERGYAILSDFGIAHISDSELKTKIGDGLTLSGTDSAPGNPNIGTPEYLAPELIDSEHPESASAKSDIYALGVTFFKLLTGRDFHQESGKELMQRLKGTSRFWRHTLPKLLARNPENRLGSLKKFAVKPAYPHHSVFRWVLRFLVAYALLHLAVIAVVLWSAKDKTARLQAAWPAKQVVEDLTTATASYLSDAMTTQSQSPTETQSSTETPAMASTLPAQNAAIRSEHDASTKIIKPQPPTGHNYTAEEIETAEDDLRGLSLMHMDEDLRRDYIRPNEDWLIAEIEKIHTDLYTVWRSAKELRRLGMRIDEIFKSRKDLVYACVDIRRKATSRINELIAAAEYQKALKLYTATNDKFRQNNLSPIPRPSFTPDNQK